MISTLPFFFFALGLVIGSFLNVVICRLNTSRSLSGRSACMSCQARLKWYDLIPLLSFFALQGRCRTCKTRISITYPLVETATGLIFLALFFKFQDIFFISIPIFAISYAYYAVMFSILIVIAVYDLRHKIIPDILVLMFGILAFIGLFAFNTGNFFSFPFLYWHAPNILEILSGIFIGLPFAILWFYSGGRWMGFGDAKLSLGLGWFLGFSRALSAMVVAFFSGAIIGICLIIISSKYGMKSEIPFALFLVFGAFVSLLFNLHFFAF